MKVFLDTSVCIAALRGHPKVKARLAGFLAGDCAISTIVTYELLIGVAKAWQSQAEKARVDRLLSTRVAVRFDENAALSAAQVRADLERTGRKCGAYDLLIAGHALSLGLPLATNNVREFSRVNGLQVQDWLA